MIYNRYFALNPNRIEDFRAFLLLHDVNIIDRDESGMDE